MGCAVVSAGGMEEGVEAGEGPPVLAPFEAITMRCA